MVLVWRTPFGFFAFAYTVLSCVMQWRLSVITAPLVLPSILVYSVAVWWIVEDLGVQNFE